MLAFSTAISMLLGHAVMVATLAFAARRAHDASPSLRLPARAWLPTLGLGALAFTAAATILFLSTRGEGGPAEHGAGNAGTLAPTGVHLTVIAVDGFDLRFVERLAASGRVRHLALLLAGARLEFPASDAPDPARTWTSMATGQGAEVHGVSGIEAARSAGWTARSPPLPAGSPARWRPPRTSSASPGRP